MNFSAKRFAEVFASLIPTGSTSKLGQSERRRAPRIDLKIASRILIVGKKPANTIDVLVSDLSVRGMRFTCALQLTHGQQFIFAVPQLHDEPVPLLCTVMHVEETVEGTISVGAEFTCPLPRNNPAAA